MDTNTSPATPTNATTGHRYTGGNVELLHRTAVERGYPTGDWAGYGQWKKAGRQVMKGQKCTYLVSCAGTDKNGQKKWRRRKVFNIAQTCAVGAPKAAPKAAPAVQYLTEDGWSATPPRDEGFTLGGTKPANPLHGTVVPADEPHEWSEAPARKYTLKTRRANPLHGTVVPVNEAEAAAMRAETMEIPF